MPRFRHVQYDQIVYWHRDRAYRFRGGYLEVPEDDTDGLAFLRSHTAFSHGLMIELPERRGPSALAVPDGGTVPRPDAPVSHPVQPPQRAPYIPTGVFVPDPYLCPLCGASFPTPWRLQGHLAGTHQAPPGEPPRQRTEASPRTDPHEAPASDPELLRGPGPIVPCEYCRRLYRPVRSWQRFCRAACRDAAFRRRRKDAKERGRVTVRFIKPPQATTSGNGSIVAEKDVQTSRGLAPANESTVWLKMRIPRDLHRLFHRICLLEGLPVREAGDQALRWWVTAKKKGYPAEDFADLPPLRRRRKYRRYRKRAAVGRIRLVDAPSAVAEATREACALVLETGLAEGSGA